MIGQLIDGRYHVTRLLGQGGMGAVYEATHTGTGRRVALKVILASDAIVNRQMIGRFQREAKAAGAIDTQHIVQVLDMGTDPKQGFPFMVMELLRGEDLQQLMQRIGPLPPELVLRIAAQICVALQKAHDAGVVHRDIKPANLFLTQRDGAELIVKLLDFGIAKMRQDHLGSSENQSLTKTGSMLGSPLYMSPEQAKGLKTIDHRTDIWSLGAVLYEALTGRTPHHGIDTLGQLIIAICAEPPASVQSYAPWVLPEIAAVVHGALTIDVDDRFQTASSMLDAIRPHLADGWSVQATMLTPMSPEHRGFVAPRLAISVGGAKLAMSNPSTTGSARQSGTQAGLAHTTRGKGASSIGWLLGFGSLLAVGAFATSRLLHRSPTSELAGAYAPSAEMPQPSPPVSSGPLPSPSPAPLAKSVRLAIIPAAASVDVDGQPSVVEDGGVEINGTLGSVHTVHVSSGRRETREEVVVTETGPMPSKIELGVVVPKTRKPAEHGQAAPVVTPTVRANAPQAGSKPPSPELDKKFE